MSRFPRRKKFRDRVATLLPDGQAEVDGVAFVGPSDAASSIAGKRTHGWAFFLTDQTSRRSLKTVRIDVTAMAVDVEDDDAEDDDEDDDG